MAKKTKKKKTPPTFWQKFTHNWSWWDSLVSGVLMLGIGYILGWGAAANQSLQVTAKSLENFYLMWGVFMFTGRGWQIARYPRTEEIKLVDLKGNFMAVLHLNYVAWSHFFIALMFAYALAPAIGELANAWMAKK